MKPRQKCWTDRWWPLLSVVAVVVAVGCAPEKPSDVEATQLDVEATGADGLDDTEAVVARIGGEEISREEFDRRIDGLVDFARARLQSEQRREDFLERMIEFEVMAGQAQQMGLGDHPRVRHAMQRAAVQLMIEDHLRDQVSIGDIDDQARRKYFEEHRDDLHQPERRRLARLVVDDEQRVQELVDRWEEREFGDDDDVGTEFRRFAFRYSQERETGDQGGDAGWRTPDDADSFGEDVFDWQPEQLQGPFEEDGRYVLKMVVEIEQAHRPGPDELEQELTERVYEMRRQEAKDRFIRESTGSADVEIDDDRLDDLESPVQPAPPPLEELPRVGH